MPAFGSPGTACLTLPVDPQPWIPLPALLFQTRHQQGLQSQTASLELELQLCSTQLTT